MPKGMYNILPAEYVNPYDLSLINFQYSNAVISSKVSCVIHLSSSFRLSLNERLDFNNPMLSFSITVPV